MSYKLFIFYLTLISAILPVLYVVLIWADQVEANFTLNYISENAFPLAHIYTLLAVVILWVVAYCSRPKALSYDIIVSHYKLYHKYSSILFVFGSLSFLITCVLSAIYGMPASNLTTQRPMIATYLAYVAGIYQYAAYAFICYQFMIFGKLTMKGWLLLILILLSLALSWSRSGVLVILFFYLLSTAYSIQKFKVNFTRIFVLIVIGLIAVFIGQYYRTGDPFSILSIILYRFYQNNMVIYFAFTDYDKIYQILTESQPWGMLQQMFSFISDRELYPSSFRLLEYWGATVTADERGHISGYAYGWLGLTYGLFKWFGLVVIFFILKLFFLFITNLRNNPTLFNLIFFILSGTLLLEFFTNLGLDSLVEKIFKLSIYSLLLILSIKIIELSTAKEKH